MACKVDGKCVKYLLFIFNFIFSLAGAGVLAVALWLRFDSKTAGWFTAQDSPSVFFIGLYILFAAGPLMILVGFVGCCGVSKESPCLMGLFVPFLLLILAMTLGAGVWAYKDQDQIVDNLKEFYQQTSKNYKNTKQQAPKETLRLIQFGLNCCDIKDAGCPEVTTSCATAIDEVFKSNMAIIKGVGIGVLVIFGMISGILLCCAIQEYGFDKVCWVCMCLGDVANCLVKCCTCVVGQFSK